MVHAPEESIGLLGEVMSSHVGQKVIRPANYLLNDYLCEADNGVSSPISDNS